MTSMEKKRRQHYVWQHYLRDWTTDGQLWCEMGGKRDRRGTSAIAVENYFYRLKEMSEWDLKVVRDVILAGLADPFVREVAGGWVPLFTDFFRIRREHKASGRSLPELDHVLDITLCNLEEDLHGDVEKDAIPILDRLRAGDWDYVRRNDQVFIGLSFFLAVQYLRTPGIQEACIRSFEVGLSPKLVERGHAPFNARAAWGLIRFIYATSTSYSLSARSRSTRATFLDAGPSTEFITGDQPALNIKAVTGVIPEEFELYYPLTPAVALLLSFDAPTPGAERRRLSDEETLGFNRELAAVSHRQLYAASERALVETRAAG